ncbi:uncharacterized protein LOC132616141 isoform X2 [Lycium barbarum]|nr:uncharacterized protein LOC132616141 isoform X2 [Lycium barbarum]XP_060186725.1 uncharacterized protein LOC132616141 isoform X2 [Lycium barbarum]XP_060186726.1 uncharacterized protein LOC132616141 isoform X2 [Lycium barbarum]
MQDMVNDVFNFCGQPVDQEHATSHGSETEGEDNMLPLPDGPNDKAKEFYELMRDGEQELYQGCVKYSKLSFLVRLYHIKCMCGMSDKAMTMIIELLHDAFENAKIPKSFYEAKKTIKKLGLSYNKIHACPNDCMLYRGADKERQECKRCSTSRWKVNSKKKKFSDLEANKKKTPQPAKVLRYFPLIPRLQRLFMSSKTSSDMRWHSVDCHKDGLLRHPRDAEAWKKFDFTFPEFSQDPHNVRLALASDGFNPFGHMSANHSIWPVVLIPYNTPPWVCMKQSNFILSMIIPGKRMPGNDIDVYLQPLIDELKELWDGVQTFDALSTETFKMRAALMWTISDFPGYGILSGWSTYDGYSSNISRCVDVNQRRLFGLKSHDCHILMQQLLPIALRNALHGLVSAVIADLSSFFRQLCSKVLNPMDLDNLQNQIILTLCHLEMIFPPSFFTVMVHLVVHLVDEVRHLGPVHYRWMYPIERFLGHLKSFVRNMAQPEGSIVEGYLADEILTFCSRYFEDVETRMNRPRRVDDKPNDVGYHEKETMFPKIGKSVAGSYFKLPPMQKLQAHRHVLINCPAVDPFIQEFRTETKRRLRSRTRSESTIDKIVHKEFVDWFQKRILNDVNEHPRELRWLAVGPLEEAKRFTSYNVNGFKFRTLSRVQGLKTQNCGVFGTFDTRSYASNRDNNMVVGGVPYYEKLVDIIELNYNGQFTVTLFKCQWANTTTDRGIKKDELGFTSVNFSHSIHLGDREEHEPYILASQAQLVYYVDDEKEKQWSAVVHLKPRDLYDMGEETEEESIYDVISSSQEDLGSRFPDGDQDLRLTRDENRR